VGQFSGSTITADERQGRCLDNGYKYQEPQEIVAEFGFTVHVPKRPKEAQALKRRARAQARRWVVERTHSWLNRYRGILIRWSKKAENYMALLHMAFAFLIYRRMGLSG
jgi:putative transposase